MADIVTLSTPLLWDRLNKAMEWSPYAVKIFGPLAGLRQGVHQLDRAVTQADAVTESFRKEVRLEMAIREVAAIRATLDDTELALVQALEAVKRQGEPPEAA